MGSGEPGVRPTAAGHHGDPLALLIVFTLAAGVAVAALLPPRLALWDCPGSPGRRRCSGRPARCCPAQTGHRSSCRPRRPGRRAVPGAGLGHARQARRRGGHRPVVRPGAALPQRQPVLCSPPPPPSWPSRWPRWTCSARPPRFTTRVVAGPRAAARSSWSAAATPRWPPGRRRPATTRSPPRWRRWPRRPPGRCRPGPGSVRLGYDTSLFTGPALAPGWPRRLRHHRQRHRDHRARGGSGQADRVRCPAGRRRPGELPAPVHRPGGPGGAAFARFPGR